MQHIEQLSKDKKLKKIIAIHGTLKIQKRKNVYLHLIGSIVSQQLSTKVAKIIFDRFLALFDSKTPTAAEIVAKPFDTMRAVGLSNSKTQYIINVAQFFIDQKLTDAQLHKLSNEEAIKLLTQIKGVGQWTVEMLLMFTIGREDVFAVDDLGIQQAMEMLYGIDKTNKKEMKEEMLHISKKWMPYRTYACMYLWRYKDNEPRT
jgi:DNA-3-methyladenine glycosylase II